MSQKPETIFRGRLVKQLRAIPRTLWMTIQQVTKRGDPDLIGCVKCPECEYGRFVAVEVKGTGKDKATELQLHKLLCIRRVGGVAMIVHRGNCEESVEEIRKLGE